MTMRGMIILALLFSITIAGVCAVAQKPPQTFDVISIKPNRSGDTSAAVIPRTGNGLTATNVTLMQLVRNAFQIQEYQVSGQPAWFNSERFDIEAKAPPDAGAEPRVEILMPMPQALLADRFKLAFHREDKEMAIYDLVVARNGHKMKEVQVENCVPPPAGSCGTFRANPTQIIGDQVSMDALATRLSRSMARTVINKTQLKGVFNLLLQWTPDSPPGAAAPAEAGPTIFTALQEQLGLRLEATKGPVEVLVIDRVERPTEN